MPNAQYRHLANEPLADVLQSLERDRASAVVEVESPQGRGEISVKNGRLLGAAFQEKGGPEAVRAILALSAGRYQLHRIPSSPAPSGSDATLLQSSVSPEESGGAREGVLLSELVSGQARLKQDQSTKGAIRVGTRQVLTSNSSVPPAAPAGQSTVTAHDKAPPLAAQPIKPLTAHPMKTLRVEAPKVEPVRQVQPAGVQPVLSTGMRTVVSHPAVQHHSQQPDKPAAEASSAQLEKTIHSFNESSKPSSSDPELHRVKYVSQPVRSLGNDASPTTTVGLGSGSQSGDSGALEAVPVASAPIETKASFLTTSIQGTAANFQRSRPATVEDARAESWDDEPVPSRRLERATLEELEELNEAIQSSVRHPLPTSAPFGTPDKSLESDAKVDDDEQYLPRVGRYEVLARLKRGGMGSVYLCRLTGSAGFQRLFAMKVLNAGMTGREPLESFFREARLLSKLHHPNIVGIVDVGTAQQPYIVLDYVEGGSLAELCQASPKERDPARVVSIILDALTGIDAAHRATDDNGSPLGIVHCDLTPHNLLVGVNGACRVADFGIATHRNTGAEALRGKPAYVAPERLLGQPGDARSDLFSLGVVLYTALSGVEPFAAETPEATLQNVLYKPIASPSEVGLCPPPSLDWVCMKALARDPEDRFQSAEEMMVHLRKVAAREELLTSQARVAEWVTSALRANIETRRRAIVRRNERDSSDSLATEAPLPPGVAARDFPAEMERGASRAAPPPPSYPTNEKTEYLPSLDREDLERRVREIEGGPLSRIPRSLARLPRKRRIGFFVALGGMFFVLVLMLFLPSALQSLFRVEPERPDPESLAQVNAAQRPTAQEPEKKATEKATAVPKSPDQDERHIELPDLPGASE